MQPKSHNLRDRYEISHSAGSIGSQKATPHESRFTVQAHSFHGRINHDMVANIVSLHSSTREIDQILVEKAQQGDDRAFGQLVTKYQRKIGRALLRLVRDPSEIEDVVQETFIKAHRSLSLFRGESAFYTWLYRIGINTAKGYWALEGRRLPTMAKLGLDETECFERVDPAQCFNTPENLLMSKQVAEVLNKTIDRLPDELNAAITLREIEGLSYAEIAKIMGCPIGTVRTRIFRARETIAEKLRPLLGTGKGERW